MIRERLLIVAAVGLGVLALVETSYALYAPARVAAASDWDAAAAEVRAGFAAGDLIVFAPEWADQIGREHLGDRVSVEMAGRADADRYRRVWEVSIRGAHAPEVATAQRIHESHHGKVTVALYEKPSVDVLYDFTSHLADARVTEVGPSIDEIPCYQDIGSGFRCRGTRVEARTLEIDYRPRRGILAPVDGNRTTRIEFNDVPLGRTLVGYTGLHDYFSRKNADGPVDFRVTIDGRTHVSFVHHNSDGWSRFTIDTGDTSDSQGQIKPGKLSSARHVVQFEVSAPSAAWRTFGFHVEARR